MCASWQFQQQAWSQRAEGPIRPGAAAVLPLGGAAKTVPGCEAPEKPTVSASTDGRGAVMLLLSPPSRTWPGEGGLPVHSLAYRSAADEALSHSCSAPAPHRCLLRPRCVLATGARHLIGPLCDPLQGRRTRRQRGKWSHSSWAVHYNPYVMERRRASWGQEPAHPAPPRAPRRQASHSAGFSQRHQVSIEQSKEIRHLSSVICLCSPS